MYGHLLFFTQLITLVHSSQHLKVAQITRRYNQGVEFMFRQSEDTCVRLPVDSEYAVGVDVELTLTEDCWLTANAA